MGCRIQQANRLYRLRVSGRGPAQGARRDAIPAATPRNILSARYRFVTGRLLPDPSDMEKLLFRVARPRLSDPWTVSEDTALDMIQALSTSFASPPSFLRQDLNSSVIPHAACQQAKNPTDLSMTYRGASACEII